jgi:hypothetical protein
MTSEIFKSWIEDLNLDLKKRNTKAALLIDNSPVHCGINTSLSNLKIFYLEPNTTSHLQPMDAGIIKAFKTYYRSNLLQHLISKYDAAIQANDAHQKNKACSVDDVDMLMTSTWIQQSWQAVSSATISNCFNKTGILPPTLCADIQSYPRSESVRSSPLPRTAEQELSEMISKLSVGIIAEENKLDTTSFINFDKDEQGYHSESVEPKISEIVDTIVSFEADEAAKDVEEKHGEGMTHEATTSAPIDLEANDGVDYKAEEPCVPPTISQAIQAIGTLKQFFNKVPWGTWTATNQEALSSALNCAIHFLHSEQQMSLNSTSERQKP